MLHCCPGSSSRGIEIPRIASSIVLSEVSSFQAVNRCEVLPALKFKHFNSKYSVNNENSQRLTCLSSRIRSVKSIVSFGFEHVADSETRCLAAGGMTSVPSIKKASYSSFGHGCHLRRTPHGCRCESHVCLY